MWITPNYQHTDFSSPLTLEDKITIFLDRTFGWQINIADQCINGQMDDEGNVVVQPIPHSGYAVLSIVLSYFEMIAKFQDGFTGTGRSGEYFRNGVHSVFESLRNNQQEMVDEVLNILYSDARCGLYHSGITDRRIILTGELTSPIGFLPDIPGLLINPHQLVPALAAHLEEYGQQLRDPENVELRENFERRFDFQVLQIGN